jgi:hypothetical protein
VQREKLKNTGREKIRALSEGGEQRANPLWYNKKIINNEAYVIKLHRLPTLEWQLKA